MKKVLVLLVTATVISVVLVTSLGVTAFAEEGKYGHMEPAPNSGLGLEDGSGFDDEPGSPDSKGPAPNAGSGLHEGSGF